MSLADIPELEFEVELELGSVFTLVLLLEYVTPIPDCAEAVQTEKINTKIPCKNIFSKRMSFHKLRK
ncbi:MAG: hypothetical protein A4S09_06225 [Proteobacteria bacterium SG_bin7]|nr:MAG: hypothetical protein A4S09_06225 [Proteobacteria bacterium SG_bin7]